MSLQSSKRRHSGYLLLESSVALIVFGITVTLLLGLLLSFRLQIRRLERETAAAQFLYEAVKFSNREKIKLNKNSDRFLLEKIQVIDRTAQILIDGELYELTITEIENESRIHTN